MIVKSINGKWAADQYLVKISHKSKNGVCCDENNMASEVEGISCNKDKGKKRVLDDVILR